MRENPRIVLVQSVGRRFKSYRAHQSAVVRSLPLAPCIIPDVWIESSGPDQPSRPAGHGASVVSTEDKEQIMASGAGAKLPKASREIVALSVRLEVITPDKLRKIIFGLTKGTEDGSVTWTI